MLPVITFDAGQTLVELDLDFLAVRLAERGVAVRVEDLHAAAPAAWRHYDALVDAKSSHAAAWQQLMIHLVSAPAGVTSDRARDLAAWLYRENAGANLWRKPIRGMVDLAARLAGGGAKVAVLSNSEGRLAELLAEVGVASHFAAIIDSGRIGIEKPDPRIFAHALAELGVAADHPAIHIGDSWDADVVGARRAGWRAVWYGRRVAAVDDPAIAIARDWNEAAAALAAWGAS